MPAICYTAVMVICACRFVLAKEMNRLKIRKLATNGGLFALVVIVVIIVVVVVVVVIIV